MKLSNIYILIFVLIAIVLPVSCADIETETSGYATMSINLDDASNRKATRSRFATATMTTSDAKTILAVLVPSIPCESRTATTGMEYSRSLVDITTQSAQFVVPLDTNIKLCLYFFRDEHKLNDFTGGAITPDGFGQSGIFTIDSETNSKTVSVEFWAISFSDVTFKISSSSSAGLVIGSSGSAKLNSAAGYIIEAKDFTITEADNSSKSVEFTNVAYDTYSYNIDLQGFIPSNEAFNVNSPNELLDIKLEPNLVEIEWFSFDNLTISQVGSSPYAVAGGTVVLNVPNEHKDNITQVISIMQVNRVGGSTIVDVTPPIDIASWMKSEGQDNVTYTSLFSTATQIPLFHGPNEIQMKLSVNEETKIITLGNIAYDACTDSDTMCFSLTWTDGLDPDLHSYYFPSWPYNADNMTPFVDNSSRGLRYWVYSNAAHKKYSVTGNLIQLGDGFTSSANEVQVWATDNTEVGDGTYLVYVEDVSEVDVQDFKLVLTGPGITDNKTYGPYDFKNDFDASTTEAVNPQAVFFIQVQNNSIVRSDKINVGDNLSSTLLQWTGPLQNSVVE
jgi:hypothetical protein